MRNRKGFTLVEVIVTLAVFAIVIGAVYSVFNWMTRVNEDQRSYVYIQDSLRLAGMQTEKDIRASSQDITITLNGRCTELKDNSDGSVIKYCLQDGELSKDGTFIAKGITAFSVKITGNQVDVKIEGNARGREVIYEQKVYLRKSSQ